MMTAMKTKKPLDSAKNLARLRKQLENQLSKYQTWLNAPVRTAKKHYDGVKSLDIVMPDRVNEALKKAYRIAVRILYFRPTDSAAMFVVERLKSDPVMGSRVDFTYSYEPFKARSECSKEEREARREEYWQMMAQKNPARYANHMALKAQREAALEKRRLIVDKKRELVKAIEDFREERRNYFKGVEVFLKKDAEENAKEVARKILDIRNGPKKRGRPRKNPLEGKSPEAVAAALEVAASVEAQAALVELAAGSAGEASSEVVKEATDGGQPAI
jgi:hypothetical protein